MTNSSWPLAWREPIAGVACAVEEVKLVVLEATLQGLIGSVSELKSFLWRRASEIDLHCTLGIPVDRTSLLLLHLLLVLLRLLFWLRVHL